MSIDNIVAIITSLGSIVAVIVTVIMSNRLVTYRLKVLEEKINDLSDLNNRVTRIETKLENIEKAVHIK